MPPKKKAANGYKFAEPLPKGTVVEDIAKKRWRLGPSIGKGGFGQIYSAKEEGAKGSNYPYVIKIEPHSNGPLFVEINFYIRHAKSDDIENFKKKKALKTFGMPVYNGSGSHQYKEEKYRFLVMDKFSTDLHKLYVDNNKTFPVDTVFKIGLQLLDILEYIHQRDYVHADIKAANVLLGATKETGKHVYLVDFGLATKFTTAKEFKPNPKKAHDGTIEFLSRDAHQGVQTRRGDLEVLAYNLIQWLGCKLPWESNLSDPRVVQKSKEDNMSSVPKMIKSCFGSKPHPKAIVDYLNYLKSLEFNSEPNYEKIKTIFTSGIKEGGGSVDSPLNFSQDKTSLKRPASRNKKQQQEVASDTDLEDTADQRDELKKTRGGAKKAKILNDAPINNGKRVGNRTKSKEQKYTAEDSDNDMAESTAEMKEIQAKIANGVTVRRGKEKKANKEESQEMREEPVSDSDMAGYTAEMKAIALSKKAKSNRKKGNRKNREEGQDSDDDMTGYTAEMKAIALSKKAKNVAVPTTSKASSRRGLVKPSSRRLQGKPPLTHGDVANNSRSSSFSD